MEEYINLRNALFLSLIIMLLIVLYFRMLNFLGKRNKRYELYATFLGEEFQLDGTLMTIRVENPEHTDYNLRLFGPDDVMHAELGYGQLEAGIKEFVLDVSIYAPGKYYLQLNTGNHRATRFFQIRTYSHAIRHGNAE